MRSVMLLLLVGCGGQSGENEKGRGVSSCDEVAAEALSDVPAEEWPDGLSDDVELWLAIDGDWTATLQCAGAEEEVATLSFDVGGVETLSARTFEGTTCDDTFTVTGATGFHLATAEATLDEVLDTRLDAGARMSGAGITVLVGPDGTWSTAIAASLWAEGDANEDISCQLLDPQRPEGS